MEVVAAEDASVMEDKDEADEKQWGSGVGGGADRKRLRLPHPHAHAHAHGQAHADWILLPLLYPFLLENK